MHLNKLGCQILFIDMIAIFLNIIIHQYKKNLLYLKGLKHFRGFSECVKHGLSYCCRPEPEFYWQGGSCQ